MNSGVNVGMGVIERMKFLLRRFGFDPNIARYSATPEDLDTELEGQTVAIVGNSRALSDQAYGSAIDAADIVIRINRAPMTAAHSHGEKTRWLALATSLTREDADRIDPSRILWMSHKRKRLPSWVVTRSGFYLHPLAKFDRLKKHLNAQPTTGAMMINLVIGSKAKSIDLYGFDFFSSLSLTGSRTQAQVPHDFEAERGWVTMLTEHDRRLILHR